MQMWEQITDIYRLHWWKGRLYRVLWLWISGRARFREPKNTSLRPVCRAGLRLRLSDGLLALNCGEADTVIIAGMGGGLVVHILEDGRRLWREVKRFVLSPQSDLEMVRRYLESSGFLTEEEAMTEEEGKYYTVMAVRLKNEKELENPAEDNERISAAACQARLRYGRCLIERKDPVLADYLEKEEARIRSVLEKLRGQKGSDSTLSDRQRSALEQLKADLESFRKPGEKCRCRSRRRTPRFRRRKYRKGLAAGGADGKTLD